jgi:hypothetical protein
MITAVAAVNVAAAAVKAMTPRRPKDPARTAMLAK